MCVCVCVRVCVCARVRVTLWTLRFVVFSVRHMCGHVYAYVHITVGI